MATEKPMTGRSAANARVAVVWSSTGAAKEAAANAAAIAATGGTMKSTIEYTLRSDCNDQGKKKQDGQKQANNNLAPVAADAACFCLRRKVTGYFQVRPGFQHGRGESLNGDPGLLQPARLGLNDDHPFLVFCFNPQPCHARPVQRRRLVRYLLFDGVRHLHEQAFKALRRAAFLNGLRHLIHQGRKPGKVWRGGNGLKQRFQALDALHPGVDFVRREIEKAKAVIKGAKPRNEHLADIGFYPLAVSGQ